MDGISLIQSLLLYDPYVIGSAAHVLSALGSLSSLNAEMMIAKHVPDFCDLSTKVIAWSGGGIPWRADIFRPAAGSRPTLNPESWGSLAT